MGCRGQLIAAGKDGQTGVEHASALWGHNVFDFWPYLGKLAPFFNSSGSHVELKGCKAAKGDDGKSKLATEYRGKATC